jgi:hypothetical protein
MQAKSAASLAIRTYISYVITRQLQGQRRSSQLEDRECDNVLRGQGYRTSQRAVMDEYGAMVE